MKKLRKYSPKVSFLLACILLISSATACNGSQGDQLQSQIAPVTGALNTSNQPSNGIPKLDQQYAERPSEKVLPNDELEQAPIPSTESDAVLAQPAVASPDPLIQQPVQATLSSGSVNQDASQELILPKPSFPKVAVDLSIPEAPQVGLRAPNFTLQTLNGQSVQLSEMLGQPLVINYWATWCIPCKQELPVLEKLHKEFSERGVTFVSINAMDQDSLENVQSLVNELNMTFPVLLDQDRQFADGYQAIFFPTTFLVDGSGVIREISFGDNTEAELRTSLENLLSGSWSS